jgi:hypothetical protein
MTAPALPARRGQRAGRAPRRLATGRNALLVVGYAIGFALVCVGSYAAGGEAKPSDQMPWLGVSIVGLMFAGFTNGLWFADARRRLSRERIKTIGPGKPRPRYARVAAALVGPAAPSENPVTHDRSTLYHRPDCELVLGRTTRPAPRAVHEANGRGPCEVCEP